ncbi:hypothetical protein OG613_44885 (plasmid) [Streptomyces sp. NBC_00015]|uniref:tetratricopeptide repeat protein n=1 Tax=Streptomyces sp. NBC_00015 TaxID=2903611 RepID=UPI003255CA46
MAQARLNKTQLAQRAELGRTTVSDAFSPQKPGPSPETVVALARVLKLPEQKLLALQRIAAGKSDAAAARRSAPGRPIGEWEPHALEVHPAGPGSGSPGRRVLPGYVSRPHDEVLADAVRAAADGFSRIVVLVGTSSTGKTRACWEAVQPLAAEGWRLWHPFAPTQAEAALEKLDRVGPRTVVWLNEAQHYLGDRTAGERIAAHVHDLLVSPERGPVLVLGTLWPDYLKQYTTLPMPGEVDLHSRVRELLSGCTVKVPDEFDAEALASAAALARGGDALLGDALTRTRADGRVTQDLAGAPELLRRYEHASPAARALLQAAMDARRLGVGLHLPQAFLTSAAPEYLSQADYDDLTDDWAERAYAELADPVHGKQAPLRCTIPRPLYRPPTLSSTMPAPVPPAAPVFRLADYLEQHGRTTRNHRCPPASFWHAAQSFLTHSGDLYNLATAAAARDRLQIAHHLDHRAADHGSTAALVRLALLRKRTGDREGAAALLRHAADRGSTDALVRLARMRQEAGDREAIDTLSEQAADRRDTDALEHLAAMLDEAGDRESAEALYQRAAQHGSITALRRLAMMREAAGDRKAAEALARQAAEHGSTDALVSLAVEREKAGEREAAEALHQQAVEHGSAMAMTRLAMMREAVGDRKTAEALAGQAAEQGSAMALIKLATMREAAGDRKAAEALAGQVAEHGAAVALVSLARMREEAGERESAEALLQRAARHGNTMAMTRLADLREAAGDAKGTDDLLQQAADHGDTEALIRLAGMRERTGNRAGADALAWQAAGNAYALARLAMIREAAGRRKAAEELAWQAAQHGNSQALIDLAERRDAAGDHQAAVALAQKAADHGTGTQHHLPGHRGMFSRLWPYGLDPDGTPTPAWQRSICCDQEGLRAGLCRS